MNIVLTDLDNTLIYSYKKQLEEKVLVEKKEKKELSYMTKKSYQLLHQIKSHISLIPVTTRSFEQYNRIKFGENWFPQYALVSNGGILLTNNKIDEDWYEHSLQMIQIAKQELKKGIKLLQKDNFINFEIRLVDNLFVFTKSKYVESTLQNLKNNLDLEVVSVFQNKEKVYILPKLLNKGIALQRIKEKLKATFILCAGDSEFDLPMLFLSDFAIFPENLQSSRLKEHKNKIIVDNTNYMSDLLLEYSLTLIN